MTKAVFKAILILPGTVLVYIPAALLLLSRGGRFAHEIQRPGQVTFWVAMAVSGAGIALMIATTGLFATRGKGTPAPWQPPRKLVIEGPYRYMRNPMITGVVLVQLGEAVLFNSWPLLGWAIVFWVGNMIYFPLFEEPSLARRFGAPYRDYMDRVPRWVPRLADVGSSCQAGGTPPRQTVRMDKP